MESKLDTSTQQRLCSLSVELRIATSAAVSKGSWFAPTLDECRLDIERVRTLCRDDENAEAHAVMVRSELALRTWHRIVDVMSPFHAPRLCECGGRLTALRCRGRWAPFRGRQVEVPDDFAIPTCERCGVESLDAETAERLDEVLLARYVAQGGA
jgi:hypothetical protein